MIKRYYSITATQILSINCGFKDLISKQIISQFQFLYLGFQNSVKTVFRLV